MKKHHDIAECKGGHDYRACACICHEDQPTIVCPICGWQDGEHNYESHAMEMRADEQFQEDMRRGEYDLDDDLGYNPSHRDEGEDDE